MNIQNVVDKPKDPVRPMSGDYEAYQSSFPTQILCGEDFPCIHSLGNETFLPDKNHVDPCFYR